MIRRPPRSTLSSSSAASDVYKRQAHTVMTLSGQTKRGDMTSGNLDLFKLALGLEDPWKVTRTDFNPEGGRLDLYLDFPRGAAFLVPSRWLRAEGVSGVGTVLYVS